MRQSYGVSALPHVLFDASASDTLLPRHAAPRNVQPVARRFLAADAPARDTLRHFCRSRRHMLADTTIFYDVVSLAPCLSCPPTLDRPRHAQISRTRYLPDVCWRVATAPPATDGRPFSSAAAARATPYFRLFTLMLRQPASAIFAIVMLL